MKKAVVVLVAFELFACTDGGKTGAKADSVGREVDTAVTKLIDAAEAKGGRLLDSAKVKGPILWDSTKIKGGRLLTGVKKKFNDLKKKDTIK